MIEYAVVGQSLCNMPLLAKEHATVKECSEHATVKECSIHMAKANPRAT